LPEGHFSKAIKYLAVGWAHSSIRIIDNISIDYKFNIFGDIIKKLLEVMVQKVAGSDMNVTYNYCIHLKWLYT